MPGIEAYGEDHIDKLDVGAARLQLAKPFTRYRVTTTDQATAEVGRDPLGAPRLYKRNATPEGDDLLDKRVVVDGAGATIGEGMAARVSLGF